MGRLDRGDHADVAESLEEVGFHSWVDLLATYAGQASDLNGWLKGAEINRDRNLRLQYLAGLSMNAQRSESIFDEMVLYRRYPRDLFTGSAEVRLKMQMVMGKVAANKSR